MTASNTCLLIFPILFLGACGLRHPDATKADIGRFRRYRPSEFFGIGSAWR